MGPVAGHGRFDAKDLFVEDVRRRKDSRRPGRGILRVGNIRRVAKNFAKVADRERYWAGKSEREKGKEEGGKEGGREEAPQRARRR